MKTLTVRQQYNRLKKFYNSMPDNNGKDWYYTANEWINEIANLYGYSDKKIATITSLLSPQQSWNQNKKNVVDFINGKYESIYASKKTLSECNLALINGWTIPKKRLKTYAFYKCLLNPDNSNHVVIDRHAIKVAYNQLSAKPISITSYRYRLASEAYKMLANELNILPSELQATLWVNYKKVVNR